MLLYKESKPYPSDIRHLTALRFLAAYCVVLYHYLNRLEEMGVSFFTVPYGYLGVDFFFILSGFILCHTYKERMVSGSFSKRAFYLYRIARIYPAHLFIVIFEAAYIYCFTYMEIIYSHKHHTYQTLFHAVSLTQAWIFSPSTLCYNCPSWSISAEWFMYLLFPFLIVLFYKINSRKAAVLSIGLFLTFFMGSYIFVGMPLTEMPINYGIIRIIPEFLFGMFLYRLGSEYRTTLYSIKHVIFTLIACIIACLIESPTVFIVILFGVLIIQCAEQSRQGVEWGLSSNMAVHLGKISYSMYLLHVPFLDFMLLITMALLPFIHVVLLVWMSCFVFIILLASALYKYVEQPCRSYIRKYVAR